MQYSYNFFTSLGTFILQLHPVSTSAQQHSRWNVKTSKRMQESIKQVQKQCILT